MAVSHDPDNEVQLEPPQQTIRAEVPETSARVGRQHTNGEARVLLHSVTAMSQKQVDAAPRITDLISRVKSAETAALAWLHRNRLCETEVWRADRDAFVRHHRAGTDGEDADDTLLGRRPRLKVWMYWSLLAVLAAADFMFFLGLWRDVEEATDWFSVQTLQAAIYGLITPVTLQAIAFGLGRVVASWLRKGTGITRSDRSLLLMLGAAGLVAVLTIVFGVMQRITMLASVDGAASVNPVLFYCLFLILPLGLGIAEVLRHDEVVALNELRATAVVAADQHVSSIIEAGTVVFDSWVAAFDAVAEYRDVLRLEMQESLYAAADLMLQERAHHGHDGAYANLLWSDAQILGGGADWVDAELPSGAFDPVLNGPVPRVNLDRLKRLDQALTDHRPPRAREWLEQVNATLHNTPSTAPGRETANGGTTLVADPHRSSDSPGSERVPARVDDGSGGDSPSINGFDVQVGQR